MKATQKNRNVSALGGIIPVLKTMLDFELPQTIRKCLGKRNYRAHYSYEDVIISFILSNFCGSTKLDHITHIKKSLNILSELGTKIPSHDTLGRTFKSLATETIEKLGTGHTKTITYGKFNENDSLNQLLVKATKKANLLSENQSYTLHMDATFIETECYDAENTYHKAKGFYPMVSTIGKLPVFISMRNGKVAPHSEIQECLQKTIELLRENKIKIGKVRMDKAGFNLKAFRYLNEQGINFYVPAPKKPGLMEKTKSHGFWQPFQLETQKTYWDCEAANIPYTLYDDTTEYRVIALRMPIKKKSTDTNWIESDGYGYKLIITNDFESSIEEVVKLVNQGGKSEHVFHALKSTGWKYPPFSFMNQNLVFFILTALANNVYEAVLKKFKDAFPKLNIANMRLAQFRKKFINIICEAIDGVFHFDEGGVDLKKLM